MKKVFINYYFENYEEYEAYKPYLKVILGACIVPIVITIINLFM